MADRQQPSRRSSSGKQPTIQKPTSSRRTDVIRCENCGEDYSITYKRGPFCDERPGRTGVGGRRVSGGGSYGGRVHPIQLVGLVISLVLIIAALFIIFTRIAPLFTGKPTGGSSNPGASQSTSQGGSQSSQGGSSGSQTPPDGSGDVSQPQPPAVTVTSITLNRKEFTLTPGEVFQLEATLTPAGVSEPVTWTSADPSLATVDEYGNVKNVNNGSSLSKTTITASCGGQSVECVVFCRPGGSSSGSSQPSGGGQTGTDSPSSGTALQPNSEAVITGAAGGLNIRSGPGTTYEVKASTQNGAVVTVLEAAENGWYKIRYNTGGGAKEEGYVLGDYLAAR